MAKGPGTSGVQSLPVKVVIQPSAGTDGQLLFEAVSITHNKSGLINQLAMRGWLNLLHGTPAVERSIQLRMIGLPDEVIAQLDALAPVPHFLAMDGGQRASATSTPQAQPVVRPQPQTHPRQPAMLEPERDPTPATAEPVQQRQLEAEPKEVQPPAAHPDSSSKGGTVFSPPHAGSGFGRDWGLS
ncbi:hypothetical protein [Paracidovorax wautersii]|uniref:hypothetical protein n=1 Tax=Paracidovorax wautersii TaxID=1177982 RepID=UPI001114055A|nr:hypothetical protein [Paracidovorax wautersii]